jgi:hypothetical protein
MVPLNILRTGFEAVLMRSHAAKYAACAAAVVVAVPVFGQTTATTATLVGARDIANCTSAPAPHPKSTLVWPTATTPFT